MALRVWLPLNGSLENKGISDNLNFSITGTVADADGKIGKSKEFNLSNLIATYDFTLGEQASVCTWIYYNAFPASNSNDWIIHLGTSSGYTNAVFGLSSRYNTKLCVMAGGEYDDSYVHNFSLNTWYHIAFTWNNTGNSYLYINGELVKTYSNLTGGTKLTGTKISLGSNVVNSSTKLKGRLNDVRIYDHCLSPLEVKEISQGLILHYKLNGFSGGVGDNILTGTATQTTLIAKGTGIHENGTWSPASGGNGIPAIINIENDTPVSGVNWGFQVTNNTSGNRDFCQRNEPYQNGVTYTVSWYMRGTGKYLIRQWNSTDGKQMQSKTGNIDTTDWTYYTWTFTANEELETDECTLHLGATGNTSLLEWCAMKMEIGSIATPWSPAPEDLGIDTIKIIDSSGYGNDGVITGNLTTETDSGRYNISTYFTSGDINYITTPTLTLPGDAITMNFWFKSSNQTPGANYHMPLAADANSNQAYEMSIHKNGYLRGGLVVAGTRKVDNCTSTKLLDGNWHMCTMTYDGVTIKRYVDAVMEKSTAASGALITSTSFVLGHYGTNISYYNKEAYESDVRIYVTALSAEDIATLYHTPAQINNLGGIHGFEVDEEQANIFRYELINPYAKTPNVVGTGEWGLRNGEWAMNIKPAPFYKNLEDDKSGFLTNKFLPNTQYVVDYWIDADDVINSDNGSYVSSGIFISYTDETTDTLYTTGGNGVGFQHKRMITDSGKTIHHIGVRYGANLNTYYRWDSYVCPIGQEQIVKEGLIKSTQFIEKNSQASIHESGSMLVTNIIEK